MSSQSLPTIHLRAETKPFEHRSISPSVIGSLVAAGYPVRVERSPTDPVSRRVFADDEYAAVGAELVETGSWMRAAGPDVVVIGLKDLAEQDGDGDGDGDGKKKAHGPPFPLRCDHIAFGHCYKKQSDWQQVLGRFPRGGGVLYDIEFLVDDAGRRVSAFGYHAGFAGAALGAKTWAWLLAPSETESERAARLPWDLPPLPSVANFTSGRGYYHDEAELVEQIRADLERGRKVAGREPTVLVLGALGRCGRGACDLFIKAGLPDANITRWDLAETSGRLGPYKEIPQHDIFVNAVYLSKRVPPFVTAGTLAEDGRRLSVIVDVSCDNTIDYNPIPVYSRNTTFESPTVPADVRGDENPTDCQVISIDQLPSMLPREASEAFSDGLRESLLQLGQRDTARVWVDAKKVFDENVALLPEAMRTREV